VKYLACFNWSIKSSIMGRGYQFLSVNLFKDMWSIHIFEVPSFLGTMMIGDPQCMMLGRITHYSRSCCNCLFTSSTSKIGFLYNPIFGNGELDNNFVSCSTSLLGGIPLYS
jgi:hypothetical protein